jgi:hypothetical protein
MLYLSKIFKILTAMPLIVFTGTVWAAGLSFSPENPIPFGDVYAYEKTRLEQCQPVFRLTPVSDDCTIALRPDPAYAAPPGAQSIAYNSPLSEPTFIWVCISCQTPGEHDFHILVESADCNDVRPVVRFNVIDFARIQGKVMDIFTGKVISTASVGSYSNSFYLTVTMLGNGAYSGVGRPGNQWIRVRAQNYREQIVPVEILESEVLTRDFKLIPIVSLSDAIAALQISAGTTPDISASYSADMNGDGKIGLVESILMLQLISGIR